MSSVQRPVDEAANLLTHSLGLLLSLVATVVMLWVVSGESVRTIAACGVYCLTLNLLYGASALSHAFHEPEWRRFFRTLDQACIYLLIAGSFTPFAALFLTHDWWWLIIVAMWILALGGVLLVLRMRDLSGAAKVTYGLLGWLPAISLWELSRQAPLPMLLWLLAGGFFYSTGTIFLRFDQKVRYLHALWHTFVIAGSICHYIGILVYIAVGR